jgi:hypothetical protein
MTTLLKVCNQIPAKYANRILDQIRDVRGLLKSDEAFDGNSINYDNNFDNIFWTRLDLEGQGKVEPWKSSEGHPKTLGNLCDYLGEVGMDIRFCVDEIKQVLFVLEEMEVDGVPKNSHLRIMNIYNVRLDFNYSEFLAESSKYGWKDSECGVVVNC